MNAKLRGAVVLGMAAVVFCFLSATAILVAPGNAIRSRLIGPVADLLLPHFNQNWGLFAPNPVNTDDSVLMRAQMSQDGKVVTTGWVDLAGLADAGVLHHLLPGRDTRFADGLFKDMQPAIVALPSDCRPWVPKDQLQTSGASLGLAPNSAAAKKRYSADQRAAMHNYLKLDAAARGLATVYAHHLWSGTVVAVQVRLRMTPVARYPDRNSKASQLSTFYYVGWRAPAQLSADALRAWK